MRKHQLFSILGIALGGLVGCEKESQSNNKPLEKMSIIPKVSSLNAGPASVRAFSDTLSLTFRYEDGDGDLGFPSPDSLSIWVKDSRTTTAEAYYLRPLAPEGADIAITGIIQTVIRVGLYNANNIPEKARFEVWLKDRAGHESNHITSGDVDVQP